MDIVLSNTNQNPIYEQICIQIKQQILDGALTPGQPLPSIRSLAKELRISVITTKRAYEELERDGYIYAVAAKGFYVSEQNLSLIREAHLRQIEEHFRQAIALAAACALSGEELWEIFQTIRKENEF